ncbi:hypothetical protein HUJ04_005375 [Dendroctonus ponderosae]|nr:hypothetical protein HUJ04_005375 [Dendroctonus ponderosae]
MLPNSTERAVTISGTGEAITQCIYHICSVMLESPPKGATIPYRPKPQVGGPVILAGGQAYTIQGNYAVPAHADVSTPLSSPLLTPHHGPPHHALLGGPALAAVTPQAPSTYFELKNGPLPAHAALPPQHLLPDVTTLTKNPLAGLAALGLGGLAPANTGGLNPAGIYKNINYIFPGLTLVILPS